ncbi:winged helix-turn-helix domain-containing protein [Arenicella xantha]|uniref:winged helix-turn-helix domain-containing protein n=1 Tax=Arenicella xantha TaxID=644221 RepID=UPI000DEA3AF9|nr:crosslink repair DNA glycosylase YcaQ family protein [Arenicella xantha]
MISLSPKEARKLALLGQGLLRSREFGSGHQAVRRAIQQLSYVQIDTISVVARAHHHTCWNRIDSYRPDQLDHLMRQGHVFEYWSHAAAYLPIEDYRYSLRQKKSFADGERHWHGKDQAMSSAVLQRIAQEGPLKASDFKHQKLGSGSGWWEWKPAKIALEQLFMEGKLMVVERRGFQKVYDLTERVLPAGIDTSMPSEDEQLMYLVDRYLSCNGLGTPAEIAYLRKGTKTKVVELCERLAEQKQLEKLSVNGQAYFARGAELELLAKPLSQTKVKILSPFDNLVIQRRRLQELFDFNYQIECYVPANKRVHGYFVLPLLWGQQMAGRMDAKVDRKTGVLTINALYIESDIKTKRIAAFLDALIPSLKMFRDFNQARQIEVLLVSSANGEMTASDRRQLVFRLNSV